MLTGFFSNIVRVKCKGITHINLEMVADWSTKLIQSWVVAVSLDHWVAELMNAWHSGWRNAWLNELGYLLLVRWLHGDKTTGY
jgi:hypothetical protein